MKRKIKIINKIIPKLNIKKKYRKKNICNKIYNNIYKYVYNIYKLLLLFFLSLGLILIYNSSKVFQMTQKELKMLNMYIITHKDFNCGNLTNPAYKILCDDKSQLTKKYSLEIIETSKNNPLYFKKRGYSEGSKIYPIWKLYKEGNLQSKYIGIFHYRRIFPFRNDIPDLDNIFKNYDAILKKRNIFASSTRDQYRNCHIIKFLDESFDIIQDKYPEYYPYIKIFSTKNWGNYCNIFIMKQEDFIKWGEFVFGVLFEFDRRHNLKSDKDIKNFLTEYRRKSKINFSIEGQSRLEGYLMERISNIFYEKHFKKRYEIETLNIAKKTK